MKAILINPYNNTILEVEHDGNLKSIYKLLDCSMIEAPVHYDNNDTMYCNENAWLEVEVDSILAGFMFPDYSYAILGKALIVGTDDEGNDVECKSNISDFDNIIWKNDNQMRNQGLSMGLL